MLKIWGRTDSSPTQRVMWTCRELDVPYELLKAGGKHGQTDTASYGGKNPNRLVPVVELDGQYLWESNTIVRCLAAKFGDQRLWISDALARAAVEKWMDWAIGTAAPAIIPAYMALIRGGDRALIPDSVAKSAAAWKIVDLALGKQPYLGGTQFSIADISLGVLVYRWLNLDIERPLLPSLEAWYTRLVERKPYRDIVMIPLT